ncbi:MAG: hypothetical protein ACK41C_16145 [Phenylobacterium sp.]|uniref:hypothetical protein n=1 Tax=Phenylobacterium sp. TaxID=1871053 RepID=UPI0039194EC9
MDLRTLAVRLRLAVQLAAGAVVVLLAGWSVWAVALAYSPTPFHDQWGSVHLWRVIREQGFDPALLFAQHNEHRLVFPRLVFLADFAWFQGRNILNLVAIGAVQAAAAALYLRAADLRRTGLPGLLAAALACGLMFSLTQWENFFWGFQVQFVGVFAAAGWAIWLFCRGGLDPDGVRWPALGGAFALLTVAAFSLSNGLTAGLAMAAVVLLVRGRPAVAGLALAATALLLAIYLKGYQPVEAHSPARFALERPVDYVRYVLTYLGNVWSGGGPRTALAAGLAGALGAAAMALVLLRAPRPDAPRAAMLGIVVFVGMTAGLTALGRLSFGVEQALAPRYATPVAHFWAAQAVYWMLTLAQAPRPRLQAAVAFAAAAGLAVLLDLQPKAMDHLFRTHDRVLAGSSAIVGEVEDPQALQALFPDPEVIQALTPFMREQRLGPYAATPAIAVGRPLTLPVAEGGACRGRLDSLEPAPEGAAWRAHGWGWDRRQGEAFDHVALVDSTGRVVGIALGHAARPDVLKALRRPGAEGAGWIGVLEPPQGEVVAYGLAQDGRACEIGRREVG